MKHRFLWLICLLLCIGIASVAMADTPTIQATMETRDGTNSTLVNAIIPQNEGDGDWYYDTWAASIAFDSENYDALCSKYGGTPTWTISDDGGLEVELFPEYATGAREDGYCGIRIFGAPEQTEDSHDYTICITCSWGELSQTYPLTVTYEKTDRIPNGCNIPPVITLKVNETSTFNWTFNDGYEHLLRRAPQSGEDRGTRIDLDK